MLTDNKRMMPKVKLVPETQPKDTNGAKYYLRFCSCTRFFDILFTLILHYGNKCITKSLPSSRPSHLLQKCNINVTKIVKNLVQLENLR